MSILSWAVIIWKIKTIVSLTKVISNIYIVTSEQGLRLSEVRNKLGTSASETIICNTINLSSKHLSKCINLDEISHVEKIIKDNSNTSLYSFKSNIDKFTSSLATIGTIAPYVGLLGTVWGLLDAFQNLSDAKVVTFQTVAPSIVEALFATAIGLFVAIPASAGYNIISKQSSKLMGRLILLNDSLINQVSQIKCTSIQGASRKSGNE